MGSNLFNRFRKAIRLSKTLFSKVMEHTHYVGLVLVVFILVEARSITQESDQTMSEFMSRQESLRNILWINLLVQRSSNLILRGRLLKDPSFIDRAKTIAESMGTYIPAENKGSLSVDAQKSVSEFQLALAELRAGEVPALEKVYESSNRAGEKLNLVEAAEWYGVQERYQRLLETLRRSHDNLLRMFALFLGYLVFLGWILRQKKKAETALLEQKKMLQGAQALARLGVWTWRTESGTSKWSKELYEILGMADSGKFTPSYELLLSHVHPEDRDAFEQSIQSLLREGTEVKTEFRIQNGNKQIRSCSLHCEFSGDEASHGKVILGILQDVTDRKMADALRAERDAAEKASQAKSAFLANMSHELRTPMHGILSFARFGQQRFASVPAEKLKSYFDEIHDSGSRLMNLLNDLLDLSKLEAGKIVYSMSDWNLAGIVDTLSSELSAFAEEKGQRLETVKISEDIFAVCDGERIMQVIRNLLSNAIKFSEKGTTIRIELDAEDGLQVCRVINHGVGIPEAELELVFDKFVQSSKTRTGAGGTGLGLAICREIINGHGGKIWAESTGNETKFIFKIPRDRPEAQLKSA